MSRPCVRGRFFIFLLFHGLAALGATGEEEAGRPGRPNIVFILVDTLRADHVSCYGYDRPTTPFIDQLAAEGVRLENFFSTSSWTPPAVASIYTGLYPLRHGRVNASDPFIQATPVLAEVLRGAGYRTLAVICNHVAGSQWGYQRGFDVFDDFSIPLHLDNISPHGNGTNINLINASGLDDTIVSTGLRLARSVPETKPYFLYIQLFDPHWNHNPLPGYREMFVDPDYKGGVSGVYWELRGHEDEGAQFRTPADLKHFVDLHDAEIRQTDDAIRRLVTTLRGRGQLNDSDVLVITSDHGDEYMEHGFLSHGKNLFDTVVKMPAIIVSPGRLPQGAVSGAMASHIDWFPTLAKLAGAPVPEGLPGIDLSAYKDGHWSPAERGHVFMHVALDEPLARPMIALRTKTAKVVRHLDDNSAAAYDLANDPGEQNPLPAEDSPAYMELLGKLDAWHEEETRLADRK